MIIYIISILLPQTNYCLLYEKLYVAGDVDLLLVRGGRRAVVGTT